jgi:hypothetical protein
MTTTRQETRTRIMAAPVSALTPISAARPLARGPRPEQRCLAPEEADRIAARVMGRLAGQLTRLRILVRRDGCVLQGQVRSYYAKQLVQEAVRQVTDRPIAENAVEVM